MKTEIMPNEKLETPSGHLSMEGPQRKTWDYCAAVYERWQPWPQNREEGDRMLLTLLQWHDKDNPLFRMLRDTILEVFQQAKSADTAGCPFPDFDHSLIWESAWSVLECFGDGMLEATQWLKFFRLCGRYRQSFPDCLLLESLLNGIHNYYTGFFRGVVEYKCRKREAYLLAHPEEIFLLKQGGGKA